MRTNYKSKHSWDHAASECVSCVGVDLKEVEFIGNKQTHSLTRRQTNKHSTVQISTDGNVPALRRGVGDSSATPSLRWGGRPC